MQNIDQFKSGINMYNQNRQADDIDLVQEVRKILMEAGLGQKLPGAYDNNHYIIEAANKPSSIQRYILNRYWNHQLLTCNANSMDQRYCLIPNGEISDWIDLFKSSVLPFIVEHNLPN